MFLDYLLLVDEKKVFPLIITLYILFLFWEENVLHILFRVEYLQMIKQKVWLLSEHLDQLSNLNIAFLFFFVTFDRNLFQLLVRLSPDFNY